MNKRSRKVRGSSRRLVALALCCVCVLAALPVYALASEAGTTPSTEASQTSAPVATDILPATGPGKDEPTTPAGGTNNDSTPAGGTNNESTPAGGTNNDSTPAGGTSNGTTQVTDGTSNGTTQVTDGTSSGTTQVTDGTSNGTTQATGETPNNSTPAEGTTNDSTQEPTQTDAPAKRTVTASAGGLEFSVTGSLTDTTTLRVEPLDTTAAAYIRDTVLNLGDQVTGAAYDITLLDNGEEIQPKEAVEVSIDGLASAQGVYHLPHTSAADVRELVKDMTAGGEKVRKAISPIAEFFGGKDIPTFEKLTASHDQGKLKFKTSGFSTYYVVFSNSQYNNAGNGLATNNDIVYMAPGASLKYGHNNTNVWPLHGLTVTPTDGAVTAKMDGSSIVISADPNAANSGPYTVEWQQGEDRYIGNYLYSSATKYKLTVYVNQEEAVKGNLKNETLYIAVRGDGIYPGEPADNSNDGPVYSYYASEGTVYIANDYGDKTVFSNDASKYISEEIGKHEAFQQSVNTTPAVGIVDHSGAAIKQFIKGIEFDEFLEMIAEHENVKATDGTVITEGNVGQYELVPYVIKYQGVNGPGWHIDCIVKLKSDVTLSYELNIPAGYTAPTTVVAPNNQSGPSGTAFNVGVIKDGTADVGTITVTPSAANPDNNESYAFTFKGWNTEPDGTGDWYYPSNMADKGNTQITITENTTLYAMWDTNPQLGKGNLKITKVVSGGTAGDTQKFTFTVTITGGTENATYNYAIYNPNGIQDGTGATIKSGGTLQLSAGQYAVINNLPSGATVAITETNAAGYTPSWTGVTQNGTVTIQGGITSQVTCTNTAAAKLTIKKTLSGNMYNENDKFDFSVTINGGNPTTFQLGNNGEKEITVPVGASVTITEDPGSYTYSLTSVTPQTVTTTPVTDGNGLSFTMPSSDVNVVINNDNTVSIDTGVLLDTLPYLLILALVGGGVVLMLGRRRRRYED